MARLAAALAALLVASSCAPAVPKARETATPPLRAAGTSSPAGASARPAASDERSALVIAADRSFILAQVEVKAGTVVTWRNDGQEVHNIFATDGSFHSPDLASGNTFSWTFTRPGRYAYLCTYHAGDGMYGALDVR